MESEADESSLIDNPDGSTVRLLGPDARVIMRHRGTRGSGGGASTHSLNEADLQVHFNYNFYFIYVSTTFLFFCCCCCRMISRKLKRKEKQNSCVCCRKGCLCRNLCQHPRLLPLYRNPLWQGRNRPSLCKFTSQLLHNLKQTITALFLFYIKNKSNYVFACFFPPLKHV